MDTSLCRWLPQDGQVATALCAADAPSVSSSKQMAHSAPSIGRVGAALPAACRVFTARSAAAQQVGTARLAGGPQYRVQLVVRSTAQHTSWSSAVPPEAARQARCCTASLAWTCMSALRWLRAPDSTSSAWAGQSAALETRRLSMCYHV
jgi:hypothetical protein